MTCVNRIAVFGATGQTGLCVLDAALKKGVKVKALVRDPSLLSQDHKTQIEVVQGDVLSLDDVRRTIEGQDAVIVTLGTRRDLGPTTVMSDGMKNIISVMKAMQISAISVCLSAFLFLDVDKVPAMFHNVNADHQRVYDALKESGLNWVAVFPPHIADSPSSELLIKHGASPGPRVVSKYDLGTFLLTCLSEPNHYQKVIGIANKPSEIDTSK